MTTYSNRYCLLSLNSENCINGLRPAFPATKRLSGQSGNTNCNRPILVSGDWGESFMRTSSDILDVGCS